MIYYSSGFGGAAKDPAAGTRLAGEIVIRSHVPSEHLVASLIGRTTAFWYLSAADRAVMNDLLHGTALAIRTDPDGEGLVLRAEPRPFPGLDRSLEAKADLGPSDAPGPSELPAGSLLK